jgi:hypothetical protein
MMVGDEGSKGPETKQREQVKYKDTSVDQAERG